MLEILRKEFENDETVVVDKFSVPMTRKKLNCLRNVEVNDKLNLDEIKKIRLNDEVINFYIMLLREREDVKWGENPSRRGSWYFPSFFMSKLVDVDKKYNFSYVERYVVFLLFNHII